MKFSQRLFRYLVGVFIGLLLVVYFFGDRNWLSWTPKQRVLYQLRDKIQPNSPKVDCLLKCYKIPQASIDSTLVHGDVLFKESDTHSEPKIYIVKSSEDYGDFKLTYTSTDERTELVNLEVEDGVDCGCLE